MKAKEYAEIYKTDTSEPIKKIGKVICKFMGEFKEISIKRGGSNGAACGVLDELSNKYRAFVRLADDSTLKPDGFDIFIKEKFPEIYAYWKGGSQ